MHRVRVALERDSSTVTEPVSEMVLRPGLRLKRKSEMGLGRVKTFSGIRRSGDVS